MFKCWNKFVDWLMAKIVGNNEPSDEEIEKITEDMDMFGVYTWPINPSPPSATEGQREGDQHNTGA